MLNGKVVFFIKPHAPLADLKARQTAKLMLTSPLYTEADDEDTQEALKMWADELSILLEVTQRIKFEYGPTDAIPAPVQAFQEWWNAAYLKPSPVTVFEQRCELVSVAMMETWNAAYRRGQLPYARDWHKPGDAMTPEEQREVADGNSPLVGSANSSANP